MTNSHHNRSFGTPHSEIRHSTEGLVVRHLLEEQTDLSAVERFSQRHAELPGDHSLYTELIPLSKPGEGEQYTFEVDLDTCSGCKACVVACHSLNGLDEDESWRDVGALVSSAEAAPIAVTSACHHCADPACLNGCPTLAYEKDADTGIVRHLDDQCIGCSYCEMKCPYGVPKYNARLGIVRKCDMCHDRLAEGEAPACVSACPNGAIKIKVIKTDAIPAVGSILPGAYESSYTRPATIFRTNRDLTNFQAADHGAEALPHAHIPLVVMLALTQCSIGLGIAAMIHSSRLYAIVAAVVGMIGMAASVLHLGSPTKAWKAFLGIRTSWLSREIIAFGAWMPLVFLGVLVPHPAVLGLGVITGLGAVFCSAMVYIDTRRPSWRPAQTYPRFFGVVVLVALAASASLPLALPVILMALAERYQFFRSMSVLKMPGN